MTTIEEAAKDAVFRPRVFTGSFGLYPQVAKRVDSSDTLIFRLCEVDLNVPPEYIRTISK